MRLTRQGWLLAIAAVALVAAGRFLGLVELYAAGAVAALLVTACSLWVGLRRVDLSVSRSVRPHRVHVGGTCTVELRIRNRGLRTTPVLRAHDPVTGTAGADLLVAPIDLRATSLAAYRLPTANRGLLTVGPLVIEVYDPFGLAVSRLPAAPAIDVTILPRIDDIAPLPRTVGPDPEATATTKGTLGRGGEDFAALRPYVVGDDLRRVHWPSSARSDDDLLVRQDDVPWQGRVCVLLDVRRATNDVDTLERAVSAAASVLRTHARRGDHIRLVATDGTDSGYGAGGNHLDALLEYLAVADRSSTGSLRHAIDVVESGATGALVVISGKPAATDIDAISRVGIRLSRRRIVRLDVGGRAQLGRHTEVVGVPPGTAFADVWRELAPLERERRRMVRT